MDRAVEDFASTDLSAVDARALIDEIRQDADALLPKVRRAFEGRAWRALGYDSWDDLRRAEFPVLYVAVEDRPNAVRELRDAGMSQRQIAGALGVSQNTVHRNIEHDEPDERNRSSNRLTAMSGGREYTRSMPGRPTGGSANHGQPSPEDPLPPGIAAQIERRVEERQAAILGEVAEAIEHHLPPDTDPWLGWRASYLREIARAFALFANQTPGEVAERSDADCLAQLRRFVRNANDYLAQVDAVLAEMFPDNVTPLRRVK